MPPKVPILVRNLLGRNGIDDGFTMPDWQCADAVNVELSRPGKLAVRRPGSQDIGAHNPTKGIGFFGVEILNPNENKLTWEIYNDGSAYRSSLPITLTDTAIDGMQHAGDVSAENFNAKYFLAYKATKNRLYCFDQTLSAVRPVGIIASGPATVADTGAGSYPQTLRHYRVAWQREVAGTIHARSELSAPVSHTPGAGVAAARISRPTPPGDSETHWLIYASPDGVNYFLIATLPLATLTYDDSAIVQAYSKGAMPQRAGTNIPPPNCRYLLVDRSRLVMASCWHATALPGETAPKNNRVWYTRVLGASGVGDDESIPNIVGIATDPGLTNWVDVGENDGSAIVGLGGPLNGVIYVFKRRGIYAMAATDDPDKPYRTIQITATIGALHQRSIVLGEDEQGQPCLYFTDAAGVYRVSSRGIQFCGRDIADKLVDLDRDAATAHVVCGWYPIKKQLWCAFRTTAGVSFGATFHPQVAISDQSNEVRGGWSRLTFPPPAPPNPAPIYYAIALLQAAGESERSLLLVPWFAGIENNGSVLRRYENPGATTDDAAPFAAFITTKAIAPAGIGRNARMDEPYLHAKAAAGTTITVAAILDHGLVADRVGTVLLTARTTESRIKRKVEGLDAADFAVIAFRVGDGAPQAVLPWEIDALEAPFALAETA